MPGQRPRPSPAGPFATSTTAEAPHRDLYPGSCTPLKHGEAVHGIHHRESLVPKNDFVGHLHTACIVDAALWRRTAVVERDDPARLDQRTPGAPVGQQAMLAMVALAE